MLRHHSDPQQLSHHDPHALPPNAHSRMAQPTHEHCVESQHNVSTADTLSHRVNGPRSVQRMERRTFQDILLCLRESKLWRTACLEHSVTGSTTPARRSKALRHTARSTLTRRLTISVFFLVTDVSRLFSRVDASPPSRPRQTRAPPAFGDSLVGGQVLPQEQVSASRHIRGGGRWLPLLRHVSPANERWSATASLRHN